MSPPARTKLYHTAIAHPLGTLSRAPLAFIRRSSKSNPPFTFRQNMPAISIWGRDVARTRSGMRLNPCSLEVLMLHARCSRMFTVLVILAGFGFLKAQAEEIKTV